MAKLQSDLQQTDREQELRDTQIALDYFIVSHNKTAAYELYRRLTSNGTYKKNKYVRTYASTWFNTPEVKKYLDDRLQETLNYYSIEPSTTPITHTDVRLNMSPEQIRQKNYDDLESLKDETDDPAVKANIIKQQTDLMNAKLQNSVETYASDALIHFYLPYDACDNCIHHDKIRNRT